jgi:HK97 gp10 family phage protein
MANTLNVDIKGIAELQLLLLDLPKRVARNGLRAAVYAAAKVIADEAKVKAPVYQGTVAAGHPPPGTLKRSIITKQIPEKSNDFKQTYYVTVRKGKKYQNQGKKGNKSQDAYYAKFVEYEYGKHGNPAHPFLRPAFDVKANEAQDALKNKLSQRIEEEFRK